MCIDNEMEKLASILTRLFLHPQLQNSHRHERGQGSHSLLEWVRAAIPIVWADAGDVPDTVSKWQCFVDLVQILWGLGRC